MSCKLMYTLSNQNCSETNESVLCHLALPHSCCFALLTVSHPPDFHLSPRLCPSTAGRSPPSVSSIVPCLLLSSFLAMSSCHLLFGRPLDLFPLLGCHSEAFGSPIVLHSCYVSGPSPHLFQCVFYNVKYLCSFPDY